MRVLGINAIFHDPAAALIVDGQIVAAAEEERFSRRKHGKRPVPFSAWELPEKSAAWCLESAGLVPGDLDAVAYSYDPAQCRPADSLGLDDPWDHLRISYAEQAPQFLAEALPGLDPSAVRYVRHHEAHAASAGLAAPFGDTSVLVCDGRGEAASHLAGHYAGGKLDVLASQSLPHSLGLFYEQATSHLGFLHSSDEYKVMALASYGSPRFASELARLVYADGAGGFRTEPVDWDRLVKRRAPGEPLSGEHADLAASVQRVTEDVLLELARWLHGQTGGRDLAMAGGVALNCVANSRLHREGPFDRIWVQPAAGDAGTALGAALSLASSGGQTPAPMPDAYLGRGWTRRRARGLAQDRPLALRAPGQRGPGGRRRAGRRPHRGLVPGAQRVRPAGARQPLAARPPGPEGQPRPPERGEGPGGIPPGRPHGAGRPRGRHLPRPAAQSLHAVRAHRGPGLAGQDPGRGARGRHRAGADRRPRRSSRCWPRCSKASPPAPACRWS